jgi:23S rRNA (uridine2552-2'-O)-methyltransferase
VDLVPLRPFNEAWVRTAVVDVLADDARARVEAVAEGPYDAVLSDMAPKTTGVRATDEARSLRLAERALELAQALGKPGSSFVTKLFMGGDFETFRARLRDVYREVKVVRPEATRSSSVEIYLVGLGLRPASP